MVAGLRQVELADRSWAPARGPECMLFEGSGRRDRLSLYGQLNRAQTRLSMMRLPVALPWLFTDRWATDSQLAKPFETAVDAVALHGLADVFHCAGDRQLVLAGQAS